MVPRFQNRGLKAEDKAFIDKVEKFGWICWSAYYWLATRRREDADIERNCTAPDYGPGRINSFLHHQCGIDACVPVPGLLRRYSSWRPALSPETRRREGPLYRVRG